MNEQEWKIKEVREGNTWENSYGVFQSYSLALEGHAEPVSMNKKFPVASPPQAGDTLYGVIEMVVNKNGTTTNKFVTKQRPEGTPAPQTGSTGQTSSWHESPEKQASINRAVALNNAVVFWANPDKDNADSDMVLKTAGDFYAWLSQTTIDEDIKKVEDVGIDDIPY